MQFLNDLVSNINSVLWGVFVLIPLLCGTGIFYTFKLRFVQVRIQRGAGESPSDLLQQGNGQNDEKLVIVHNDLKNAGKFQPASGIAQ